MAALIKMSKFCFKIHDDIDHHTTKYVKTMETGDAKEVSAKSDRAAMGCM